MNISSYNPREITQIGHYEILDCIGRGGMGLVYRARDTRLDRQVAIKCLRTELFEIHYRERFRREALLLAKLNHPYIVQIYDYLETDEQLALVMEYVDGRNLQTQLREQIVPLKQRMQWLVQIAQGLAVAHDAGIIHRDLKAENILINKRNTAKISDLGIAKSQDFNATLTDHVAGSYCSMSPEQAMGEELDFKSDLFSFGILAYQLLCGAHPFGETDNKLQLMQRIISHPPIPPTKRNPDLPPEICTLLGQLLSKNTDNRPDNTHWVAGQLEKLSQLMVEASFEKNDTEMLPGRRSGNGKNSNSAIRTKQTLYSEHPTFDTGYSRDSTIKPWFGTYMRRYKIALAVVGLIFVAASSVGIWQLQPKSSKYVAVIPPTLTANGMQEAQQELVKGAVFDAIQQSVIQLEGYYLIPRNEITEVNGDMEAVRRATAADELITTEIQCKIEACTIILSRLTAEIDGSESRLKVQDTRTMDVLTNNYLSVLDLVQIGVGKIFATQISTIHNNVTETDYKKFLEINLAYRNEGANTDLLARLDNLKKDILRLPATQTLYTDISLDLFHETKDPTFLYKIENVITESNQNTNNIVWLQNTFYLKLAQQNYPEAEKILVTLGAALNSSFSLTELSAYLMMAKRDYGAAISFYNKALKIKKTSNALYYLALAYWHTGNTPLAKKHIEEALNLSPNYSKARGLRGIISLLNGDINNAILDFENLVRENPKDPINLSNLGLCYLLLNRFEEAYALFDSAEKIATNNILFILNKGDAKNLAGDTEEATEIYRHLIEKNSVESSSRQELNYFAQAYAHLGMYSEALKTLRTIEQTSNDSFETDYTAALVHTLANNGESALFSIENALKKGMNKIWFSFPWFNRLCSNKNFTLIMTRYGEHNRCSPQVNAY